ncbi:alpha/beta fold hydrolase [Pseudoalteromonas luteoviolacea]|uniref:alpha/beta hydrolase family protein n=1 Tax=Pseudoalteromonas luteoviolacea TaxID=43657 RepID=UPI001B3A234D|nr:alpha/beta fold hydrolase [Pseudoalteromonas luteoviolacea]MBQ4879132.1 alpha/beta fold hydrolase [Pseudoalteromonas luteoviolacea]MBQ4908113.1 alpha/beta fold hydrolase [Pseudoalteromonas luteoviolacea]
MPYIVCREITVHCEDKYRLSATVFLPKGTLRGATLIGPATGIKRQFYTAFAEFLAANGYGVLTYDNRGIGQSLQGNVSDHDATLQSWGQLDQQAAIAALIAEFPDSNYHLIGHSAGGQLIGLASNALKLNSMFNVASSSGRLLNMKLRDQVKSHFFMNVFIPFSNLLFGHTKSQWFGMGEPLPSAVSKQWRSWCNGKGYVKTAFGKTIDKHYFSELTLPALWVNAVDDFIANDKNVRDMMSVSPNMKAETLTLKPKEFGLKEIGHMKFFSRRSEVLWQICLDWLVKHSEP